MDDIERALRALPRRISVRLSKWSRQDSPDRPEHAHWRDLPQASRGERIGFIAILVAFALLYVPVLLVVTAAIAVIRLALAIAKWFGLRTT